MCVDAPKLDFCAEVYIGKECRPAKVISKGPDVNSRALVRFGVTSQCLVPCKVLDIVKYSFILTMKSPMGKEAVHMEPTHRTGSPSFEKVPPGPFRELLADAIRFWERRRVVYNLVLIGVVVVWIIATWPHFRPAMDLFPLLQLIVLGLIANALYCAAYFVDIPMQSSSLGADWRRWRWALWTLGMLLAFLLTNYWISDEIYPYVD